MTTFVNFVPSPLAPFQFQATLDGNSYLVTILWSLYGQRWHFRLTDLSGNLILYKALVGSPPNYDLNLILFYFQTSTLLFRQSTQQFEIGP